MEEIEVVGMLAIGSEAAALEPSDSSLLDAVEPTMLVWIIAATSWYVPGYPATIQPPALWPRMATVGFRIPPGVAAAQLSVAVVK